MSVQALYLLHEGFAWLFSRKASLEETKALRKGSYQYWKVLSLKRRGRFKEAYKSGCKAYSFLSIAEPKMTTFVMAYTIVTQLDDLGKKLGIKGAARKESEELLQIIDKLQDASTKQRPEFKRIAAWLEYKVSSEPELQHD
jgi:hypothetical protein